MGNQQMSTILSQHMTSITISLSAGRFKIKMPSYQYRKSHCGDKTVIRSSYLHNGISYTGKKASLYWISPQDLFLIRFCRWNLWTLKLQLTQNHKVILWTSVSLNFISLIDMNFSIYSKSIYHHKYKFYQKIINVFDIAEKCIVTNLGRAFLKQFTNLSHICRETKVCIIMQSFSHLC